MLTSKLQNMKQSAYLDYFKSFSINANDTLKKLQQQFKQQIQDQIISTNTQATLKKIKTLLGSYEILIYQINDSCEFVQIPQFGLCLVKIFLQTISIIKFLLVKLVEHHQQFHNSTFRQEKFVNFNNTVNSNYNNNSSEKYLKFERLATSTNKKFKKTSMVHHHNSQPYFSQLSSSSSNTFNNYNFKNSPSQLLQTDFNNNNNNKKNIYKQRQQSKFLVHTLNRQLDQLQIQQVQNRQLSKNQLKALIQGKEKLQSIQTSQNENILTQTLNSFCKKGEHLKNFVTVRQTAMMNNMKESMSGNNGILKVKDILDEDSTNKMTNASIKLQSIFKYHVQNYLREKQQEMKSFECQVNLDDTLQLLKLQQTKHTKKFAQIKKKLQHQIEMQKQKNKSMQNLLKSKIEQFEMKTMEYRVAKIEMDNLKVRIEREKEREIEREMNKLGSMTMPAQKSMVYCGKCRERVMAVNSNKSVVRGQQELTQSKGTIEDQDILQFGSGGQLTNEQNQHQPSLKTQQTQRDDNAQLVENHSRLMQKINRNRVHYQSMETNNLTRKGFVNQFINQSLVKKSDLLEYCSNQWQVTVLPTVMKMEEKGKPKKEVRVVQTAKLVSVTGAGNSNLMTASGNVSTSNNTNTTNNNNNNNKSHSNSKKKTIFAGRPFHTNNIDNIANSNKNINNNDESIQYSSSSNIGNQKRLKTKKSVHNASTTKNTLTHQQNVLSFSFGGVKSRQMNMLEKQERQNIMGLFVKQFLEKMSSHQPEVNDNCQNSDNNNKKPFEGSNKTQQFLRQLAESFLNDFYQNIINLTQQQMKELYSEDGRVVTHVGNKNNQLNDNSKSKQTMMYFMMSNNNKSQQGKTDILFRTTSLNRHTQNQHQSVNFQKFQGNDNFFNPGTTSRYHPKEMRNTTKIAETQKYNQNSLSPQTSKHIISPNHQSLNRLLELPSSANGQNVETIQQTNDGTLQKQKHNQSPKESQNIIKDEYPKLIKFTEKQKLLLTMRDLTELFVDMQTAKNFQYMSLFQSDQVKGINSIKIKRNASLNPTQQQLKKKNIANGLIKRTKQQQEQQYQMSNKLTNYLQKDSTKNIRIQVAFASSKLQNGRNNSAKLQSIQKSKEKNRFVTCQNLDGDEDGCGYPSYTVEYLVVMLLKQLKEIRKVQKPSSSSIQSMTVYETIRNFLRYPHSTISLWNDKEFIQKQRHQPMIQHGQLRKIIERILVLHQNCSPKQQFIKHEVENYKIEKQNYTICRHVAQFFEKIGIVLFPTQFINKNR